MREKGLLLGSLPVDDRDGSKFDRRFYPSRSINKLTPVRLKPLPINHCLMTPADNVLTQGSGLSQSIFGAMQPMRKFQPDSAEDTYITWAQQVRDGSHSTSRLSAGYLLQLHLGDGNWRSVIRASEVSIRLLQSHVLHRISSGEVTQRL